MTVTRTIVHALIALPAIIFGGIALWAIAFFAWVTTTPATPQQISQARTLANLWLAGLLCALAVSFANPVSWWRAAIRRT